MFLILSNKIQILCQKENTPDGFCYFCTKHFVMRIAILADPIDLQQAGVHIYTRQLVEALIKYDLDNEYILVRHKRQNDFPDTKQIIIKNYPKVYTFPSLRLFFIIPQILKYQKVDAVLEPAHFGPFNLPKRIKRITVIHDLTPFKFSQMHRWRSQVLQKVFLKNILHKASLILTNSKTTTDDLNAHFPFTKEKSHMIYLGKEEMFKPTYDKKVLEQLGINKPYFLYVGTIEPRKNLISLLRAFQQIRDKGKVCQLLIIGGKGWKYASFFREHQMNPYKSDIILPGYIPRDFLPAIYSQSLAFVFPSFYEGFGLPVLEAMSCKSACILSDTSSLKEIFKGHAHFFHPEKHQELASRMIYLFDNPHEKEELAEKAFRLSKNFSWKKYVAKFKKALSRL